jgi:hypothetical protein
MENVEKCLKKFKVIASNNCSSKSSCARDAQPVFQICLSDDSKYDLASTAKLVSFLIKNKDGLLSLNEGTCFVGETSGDSEVVFTDELKSIVHDFNSNFDIKLKLVFETEKFEKLTMLDGGTCLLRSVYALCKNSLGDIDTREEKKDYLLWIEDIVNYLNLEEASIHSGLLHNLNQL